MKYMTMYREVNHLTFNEYLSKICDVDITGARSQFDLSNNQGLSLSTLIGSKLFGDLTRKQLYAQNATYIDWVNNNIQVKQNAYRLWKKLIEKYGTWYCLVSEDFDSLSEFEKTKLVCEILTKLDETFDKYSTIIYAYEDEKDHLLNGGYRSATKLIDRNTGSNATQTATGTDKFKDTPQSAISPSSDEYNSEVRYTSGSNAQSSEFEEDATESVTENYSPDSVIDRLANLEQKYKNLWQIWVDEFSGFFISPANIEE